MKLSVAAAALALAIGTAASAFAAPPTTAKAPAAPVTTPAPAHAAMATPARSLKIDGTIKTVSDTGFTLTSGKNFKLDTSVKSSALKAGEKVKVEYRMKNHERWAHEVSPS